MKLNVKGRPFSWSYTQLKNYEGCPWRWAQEKFYCAIPFKETEAIIYGNRVHKAAELALQGINPKDPEAEKPVWPYIEAFMRSGLRREAELEIALTRNFTPINWFAKAAWFRIKLDVILTNFERTNAKYFDWKGLALDTKIPTPFGWTTMADLKEGDKIFSGAGSVCTVIGKSEVFNRKCYRVVFRDGATVVCDDQQLWLARRCLSVADQEVLSAADISDIKSCGGGVSIPVAGPAQHRRKKLPIHPYVLGCWLGDGSRSKGEICKPNPELFENIRACGFTVGPDISSKDRTEVHTVYGLSKLLRAEGLLKNKHIPPAYLESSIKQRVELLQGLFDTDGSWNSIRKQAVFVSVDKGLADQVVVLLSSLGQRPYCVELTKRGFGKTIKGYDVIFTPRGINPFKSHKNVDKVKEPTSDKAARRYIKSAEEIPSVPTQCIAVDAPDSTYLCTDKYIVTHNTGKKIRHDDDQLKLGCAALSVIRPEIEKFEGKLIWTKHKTVTGMEPLAKDQISEVWQDFLRRVRRMEDAWNNELFPARPSGLCPWCNVKDCASRRG